MSGTEIVYPIPGLFNGSIQNHNEMCEASELAWLNATENDIIMRSLVNFSETRSISFSVPVYGFLTPFLLLITFFTNSVVVAVLSRPHMKSPSNFILCAMAISDLLTLGIPVPMFFYQYTLGYHREPVPCYLAYLDLLMTDILPTICHSASIWLTLMLAVQRYIYVCHPTKARVWCTIPRVTYGTVVIYGVACVYNFPRLFGSHYFTVYFPWECQLVTQCAATMKDWAQFYYPVFYWFRVTCVNVLPCLLLVVLNTFLVISLNEAQATRKRLFSERKQESTKQRDSNCTTMMLVAVVFVFLVVELPLAGVLLVFIIQNTWKLTIIQPDILPIIITFSNLCICLSYSIYFPIYCSMSRQFRETFKELFIKAKLLSHDATRNGRRTSQRQSYLRPNGPHVEETNYISTADDGEYNKTFIARVSTIHPDRDGGKESETLV